MPTDSEDEALFASLAAEESSSYRDTRIQQLNAEFASSKTNRTTDSSTTTTTTFTLPHQSPTYPTLPTDQSVLDHTTSSTRSIIHFSHPDFARCDVMDAALARLAAAHHEVRFARVDVRNTPFLVEKLGIRVLPCVIGFRDGVGVERVVGFEGLGERGFDAVGGGFRIGVLERRMVGKGVFEGVRVGDGEEVGSEGEDGEEDESGDGERRRNGLMGRVGTAKAKGRSIRSGRVRRGMDEEDDDDWD
ncbi:Thioredoxin domain-containing protein [Penicillium ucsense]|uniref:Thioredoxin domain-containing protein n=1 Tax=Penicillium ucsense TaxID=2839758 RepID=A0A8J8WIU0_9EURO|nr:Thioredoxin domain-containing protein [Penicillium ucsense]KAF7739554.1 Thioredoxin domain-containing protein [Penicillium ucsense]